jgi:16S rRNA (cytosine967-C5)-methyltransferase
VRETALRILTRVDRGGAYADILLDRAQRAEAYPDPRDRALLTELVMGTLRTRGILDDRLVPCLSRPLEKTDATVRNALRTGAYQILFLRVPDRVAIYETVEVMKRLRGPRPAALVNAVLRGVARSGEGPDRDSVALLAPDALRSALVRSMGDEEAAAYLAAALERPPFTVRANRFRTTREALLARLSGAGMKPAPCRFAPEGMVLSDPGRVHADPGFLSGEYLVMDEGAQLMAPLLVPKPGEEILDACAAPGGKATHLAALAGGKARVTAADLSEGRVRILKETGARLGVPGISPVRHDFSKGPLPDSRGRFHKVLVDAPCTGMGVIRRNPDAKWRFDPGDPKRMGALQRSLLRNAWTCLRPGGLLVYCTCSPLREEDEEVVEAVLPGTGGERAATAVAKGWPGPKDAWTDRGDIRISPHRHGTDFFYAAVLRKAP